MWFSNLSLLAFSEPVTTDGERLTEALGSGAFRPCTAQEPATAGWVPPLGAAASDLVHEADGCQLLCLQSEERLLPASVVRDAVEERAEALAEARGKPLGRAERAALKESVILELLPRAFTRRRLTYAYIDPRLQALVVDSARAGAVEAVTGALRRALGSLPVAPARPASSPAVVMTGWVGGEGPPPGFELEDSCELRDPGEEGVVRCRGQDLSGGEIRTHLEAGKQVTQLGLRWEQRLSFLLGEDLRLRRLRFLDVVQEHVDTEALDSAAAVHDAEFALMSGELRSLVPALLAAFD